MKSLRRYNLKDHYYFITTVTYNRQRLLLDMADLIDKCWPVEKPDDYVILPDHMHLLVNIKDGNISDIMHLFKIKHSRIYRDTIRSGRVWQNRFWDHIIRNQDDMNRHIDYIHYNPVKHRYVTGPFDWKHSSIHNYRDYYPDDWGVMEEIEFDGEYGE